MKPKVISFVPRQKMRGYPKSTRLVKPLRYYLSGGPDIDGDALKQDKSSTPDPEADADCWTSIFGTDADGTPVVFADPFCDPRQDVFSIASMSSCPSFKSAVSKAMESAQSGSVAPATDPTPPSDDGASSQSE